MRWDSQLEGCGFKSQQCTLDGHFSHCKNCIDVCLKKTKNKRKRGLDDPLKKLIIVYVLFTLVHFKHKIFRKTVGVSGNRTRIVRVEGEHADHLTNTSSLSPFSISMLYSGSNIWNVIENKLSKPKGDTLGIPFIISICIICQQLVLHDCDIFTSILNNIKYTKSWNTH